MRKTMSATEMIMVQIKLKSQLKKASVLAESCPILFVPLLISIGPPHDHTV